MSDLRDEAYESMYDFYANHRAVLKRQRMRWWKHARQYVSMRRLLTLQAPLPSHPPWTPAGNWWPKHRYWGHQG